MLRDANRAFQKKLAVRITPLGVPPGHWYVLRVLWQQDGLSQAQIAQRAGISTATTMVALQALLRTKHIRRAQDRQDRRKNVIYLTTAGRALEEPCLVHAREVNDVATQGIPAKDVDRLLVLLHSAIANLSADGAEEPDPQEFAADAAAGE